MKKLILFGSMFAVLSFAVALGVKTYTTNETDLFMANIEALTQNEKDNKGYRPAPLQQLRGNDKASCGGEIAELLLRH